MAIRVIKEDVADMVSAGSIVFLRKHPSPFDSNYGKNLTDTNHMFLVITKYEDGSVDMCPISSNMSNADRFGSMSNLKLNRDKSTNLNKPSYASCKVRATIDIDQIYKVVGHITKSDLVKAKKLFYMGDPVVQIENDLKESRVPEVGIFYVIDGTVYAQSDQIRDLKASQGNYDSDGSHYEFWKSMRFLMPEMYDIDYDYYPRGRIVYKSEEDKFYIYLDKCITDEERDSIIDEFNLPRSKVKFEYDEHYQCHECNPDYSNISENW